MTLHFAYGANMDREGMRRRCPHARGIGIAVLGDYRFIVTRDGYASVVGAAGHNVHGVLWRLTPRDLAALNTFESLDSGLYRRAALPVWSGGRRMTALVYIGRDRGEGRPKPGYIQCVIAAAREWQLPEDYARSLARWAPGRWQGRHPAETGTIA